MNKQNKIKKLSEINKLSCLIRLAVADAKKVQKMKNKYKLDMDIWHEFYKPKNKCYVCMAGAVMAMSLNTNMKKSYTPYSIIF